MDSKTRRSVLALLSIGVLLLAVWTIAAASDELAESLSIAWWTADGGGGDSSGGPYTLRGTAGQPDAGRASGGDFALVGGFWAAAPFEPGVIELFMPMVTR
jgi:hypothetical protein